MTDVVGSTALWESHEQAMPAVLARHDEIVHGAVAGVGGHVFKHTGDGMIAVFDDAEPAIAAARGACDGLAAESWSIPGEIRIRASLHAGAATERDGDFFGPALNRLARINGVAHPDQIVASDLVHRLVADPTGIDLGEHQLRDLGEPVRLWQLDDGSHPPLRSMRAEFNNLPVQLTEFIGREAEVERLDQLVADHRLVTISGMGGCGKTRIALEVAAAVSARFDGGTWLADLRSAASPEDIVQQVAVAIGLINGGVQGSGGQLADLIVEYADRAPTLVVLDNCEHLVDDAADVAEELLRGSRNLTILATSREALGTDGERVWRIPSMGADSGEARDLFLARAFAASSDFEVGEGNVELVDRICTQLDGIPLAIELAAGRVGHLSLSELEAGLDERFALLSGGRRARRQRQQTLQAMMDWSWDLLDSDEQTLLTELAVFRGGFDAAGVEAVCSRPEMGTRVDVLTGLVDRSLVQVAADSAAMSRYQLLETVRLYGLDRLAASGSTSEVRDRHADWVRRNASCLTVTWDGPDESIYWMRNADNLLAAAEWFAESGDVVAAAEILSGRVDAYALERSVEGRRWFTKEFVDDPRLPDAVGLAVSNAATFISFQTSDYLAVDHFVRGGLDRFERLGGSPASDTALAFGALLYGHAAFLALSTDLERARVLSARARKIWTDLGDTQSVSISNIVEGMLALSDGDFEKAVELSSFEATDPGRFVLPQFLLLRMVNVGALSSLERHDDAVAAVRDVPSNIISGHPSPAYAVWVGWVLVRAGMIQEALDLIARPARSALGGAIEQWRFGRSLVLAEYVIDRDPDLAARLLGCASVPATAALGLLRDQILTRARAVLGDRVNDLLAQGAADGEELTVAEAHTIIRADGLAVD